MIKWINANDRLPTREESKNGRKFLFCVELFDTSLYYVGSYNYRTKQFSMMIDGDEYPVPKVEYWSFINDPRKK